MDFPRIEIFTRVPRIKSKKTWRCAAKIWNNAHEIMSDYEIIDCREYGLK